MTTTAETVRYAGDRGEIIRALKETYTSEMTPLRTLLGTLDLLRVSLSQEDLEFHLTYLSDRGYVRIWRAREMPGYRRDRRGPVWWKPETIMFAHLLPRGLNLLDGQVEEDPGVRF